MYLKRKRGFILLEVLAFLTIIITLIMLFSKMTSENIIKSSMYSIDDDLLTLDEDERALIKVAEEDINSSNEIKGAINEEDKFKNINYEKKLESNNKMRFKIKNGKCFIILDKINKVFYREFYLKRDSSGERLIIIPATLQGYNFNI